MNHSCDPNTWFVSDSQMTARRDISEGEELTYDYSTSETSNDSLNMNCNCGSSNCRQRVSGDDFKVDSLRKTYVGHRLSYIDALLLNDDQNIKNDNERRHTN